MTQHATRLNAESNTNVPLPAHPRSPLEWVCTQWFWARDHQAWSDGLRELARVRVAAIRCGWIEMVKVPAGDDGPRKRGRLTPEGRAVLALLLAGEGDHV